MPNEDTHKTQAFGRWAGALILGLTLVAGETFAAQQPVGSAGTPAVADRTAAGAATIALGMLGSGADEGPRIRLAGGLRLGVGLGGGGVGLYGPTYGRDYCDQPGFCYPAPRVVHEEVLPRRMKRRAAVPKVAQPRRKVRAVQAAKPKGRVVRSLAAAPEPVAEVGAPYAPGRTRGGGPVAAGDSTGGGRSRHSGSAPAVAVARPLSARRAAAAASRRRSGRCRAVAALPRPSARRAAAGAAERHGHPHPLGPSVRSRSVTAGLPCEARVAITGGRRSPSPARRRPGKARRPPSH